MKKSSLILLLALLAPAAEAGAQNIALGERVPELKIQTWLDNRQPEPAPTTYIEFFHTSNQSGTASLDHLEKLSRRQGTDLRIVVVAQEPKEKIARLLDPYLSPRICVALDPDGRIFRAFGVSYVPFGVLVDERNRALWMGNTLQLTPEIIENNQ